ncbi:hypothetical protein Csa_017540 [Cucumis sativus]|nr:hypothetical protein Csa_017540 [Cucumis sativus]
MTNMLMSLNFVDRCNIHQRTVLLSIISEITDGKNYNVGIDIFLRMTYFCTIGIYRHMPTVYYYRLLQWTNADGIECTVGSCFKTKMPQFIFSPNLFFLPTCRRTFPSPSRFFLTFLPPTHVDHPFPSSSSFFLILLPPTHERLSAPTFSCHANGRPMPFIFVNTSERKHRECLAMRERDRGNQIFPTTALYRILHETVLKKRRIMEKKEKEILVYCSLWKMKIWKRITPLD